MFKVSFSATGIYRNGNTNERQIFEQLGNLRQWTHIPCFKTVWYDLTNDLLKHWQEFKIQTVVFVETFQMQISDQSEECERKWTSFESYDLTSGN